jgi:LPXTG-motif cell wall-anchored protein
MSAAEHGQHEGDVAPDKSSGPSWGNFLVAIIALAVIVVAAVLLLVRRRRRQV